jgi:hypothetical protein
LLVTGASQGKTSYSDYATIAYTPTGSQLWIKRYNGPANRNDAAYSVAVPGNGKVYITGRSQGTTSGYDYATISYNVFTGAPLWVQRVQRPRQPLRPGDVSGCACWPDLRHRQQHRDDFRIGLRHHRLQRLTTPQRQSTRPAGTSPAGLRSGNR